MRARTKTSANRGRDGFMRRLRVRGACSGGGGLTASRAAQKQMDWPLLMERLGVARHRWDLAVLCNLDEEEGRRPADLLAAVNSRSGQRQLSAQVLSLRLRALEDDGYVRHDDLCRIPLVRVYFLLPRGRVMLGTLRALAPWDREMPDRRSRAGAAGR